jgi:hypothetical protein
METERTGRDGDDTPEPLAGDAHRSRLPSWLVPASLPEALAVGGGLAYGVVYIACSLFYSPLGIAPSEVGLGYVEIVAQSATYLAIFAVVGAGFLWLATRLDESIRREPLSRLVGLMVLLTLVFVWSHAFIDRARVQDGKHPLRLSLVGLKLLPWSNVEIARVQWTDATTDPSLPGCVIRMGAADGTEVLYDPSAHATLRIPQDAVAVTIEPRTDEC